MSRPVHFEMSAEDPDALARFYAQAFGWMANKWDPPEGGSPYWLVSTGEGGVGIDGGFMVRDERTFPGTTVTLDVDDLDASIEAVEQAGGQIVVPRMEIPNVGLLAYAADPAGNAFGMMQSVPQS